MRAGGHERGALYCAAKSVVVHCTGCNAHLDIEAANNGITTLVPS